MAIAAVQPSQDLLRSLEDHDLVMRCLNEIPDETTSYNEIVRRYYPYAITIASRLLDRKEDAEEVAQDSLVLVFHHLKKFDSRSSFKTWFYQIVQNTSRNRLSKNKARTRIEEAMRLANQEDLIHDEPYHEDQIQSILQKMTHDDREIIVMRYFSEFSLEEMSKHFNIGLSATKMRLYRAMNTFKELWQNQTTHEDE